jgi:hypothetical protein
VLIEGRTTADSGVLRQHEHDGPLQPALLILGQVIKNSVVSRDQHQATGD